MTFIKPLTTIIALVLCSAACQATKNKTANNNDTTASHFDKTKSYSTTLHDIWAVTHINSIPISNSNNRPTLEINLTKMMIFGTDGCNNYSGKITTINNKKINFGTIASTEKMCLNTTLDRDFNQALLQSSTYKKENLNLYIYNSADKEVLRFKKVD